MRLMHTRLPDMFTKLKAAAKLNRPDTEVSIRGLSDIQTGKVASLRVGRVESDLVDLTSDPEIVKVDIHIIPRIPETAHTVIMKGIRADGSAKKAILENLILTSPPAFCELYDVEEVEDRRTPFKVAEPK